MQLIIFSVYVCCLNVALAAMLGSNNEDMAEMVSTSIFLYIYIYFSLL